MYKPKANRKCVVWIDVEIRIERAHTKQLCKIEIIVIFLISL